MQNGTILRQARKRGSAVWCYRWRENGPDGREKHRRMVIGTVKDLRNKTAVRQAIVGLKAEINARLARLATAPITLRDLAEHYRQRELSKANVRITYSSKKAYAGYLKKWIVPRWGSYLLASIKAVEVEQWLSQVERSPSTRAKLRNIMSVLFNHARRHDLFQANPIQFVRQSAKRRKAPDVLTPAEVQALLHALPPRVHVMVLLAVSTGLRQSELFGLKWKDIDFAGAQISVTRSIVQQVVGICKTEASQKPVPMHPHLARALRQEAARTCYRRPEDWVFASPRSGGRRPYWGQQVMNRHLRPALKSIGISKRVGWHTFRHTYSTLLRATGAELKAMQELLRHASIRVTLDHYTQAVTSAKRAAQSAVVGILLHKRRQKAETAQKRTNTNK